MRKVLITITMLVCLMAGSVVAQVEVESPTEYIFGGVSVDGRYDSQTSVVTTSIGVANKLSGNLWLLSRTNIGEYGSFSADVGYFIVPGESLRFGLIAGPNVDWIPQEGDAEPISYIVGASGFVIGYAPKSVGAWLGAKYKFSLVDDTYYQDGWQAGFWFSFGL